MIWVLIIITWIWLGFPAALMAFVAALVAEYDLRQHYKKRGAL